MFQKYIAVGRTTSDLRLRYTSSGVAVANFTLAINRKQGKADFIPCVAWNDKAKAYADNIGKGSLILVEGEFNSYESGNDNGEKEYSLQLNVQNVKFLDLKEVGISDSKDNTNNKKKEIE